MYNFLENDSLIRTLNDKFRLHFTKLRKRIRRHFYENSHLDSRNSTLRDFIRIKTRFYIYNILVMSFVNLISDSIFISGSLRIRDRLRLRIVLRKQKSSLINNLNCLDYVFFYKLELNKNDDSFEENKNNFNFFKIINNIETISNERFIIYVIDLLNNIVRIN